MSILLKPVQPSASGRATWLSGQSYIQRLKMLSQEAAARPLGDAMCSGKNAASRPLSRHVEVENKPRTAEVGLPSRIRDGADLNEGATSEPCGWSGLSIIAYELKRAVLALWLRRRADRGGEVQ